MNISTETADAPPFRHPKELDLSRPRANKGLIQFRLGDLVKRNKENTTTQFSGATVSRNIPIPEREIYRRKPFSSCLIPVRISSLAVANLFS
jgi:hypothetical protein